MNRTTLAALLAISLTAAVPPGAGADQTTVFTATLAGGAEVALQLPSRWKASARQAGPSTTIRVGPSADGDFVFLITLFPLHADSPVSTAEGLRAAVLHLGNSKLHTAIQESIELVEITSDQLVGYLYHLTDRMPGEGPGNYREAHQGMLLLPSHVASATILTHTADLTTKEEAMRALKSVTIDLPPVDR
jgi:hypothetical protein